MSSSRPSTASEPRYRYCGPADLDWLVASACLAYHGRMKDVAATRLWIAARLVDENTAFVRSGRSVVVVNAQRRFYDPAAVRAKVLFFWSLQPNLANLLHAFRGAEAWAMHRGATALLFDESEGRDIAPLAKRLGAVLQYCSYAIDLRGRHGGDGAGQILEDARDRL